MARIQAKTAEGQAKQLAQRLRATQSKLDRLVAEVAGSSETSVTYWMQMQRKAKALYEDLRKITKSFVTSKIPLTYDLSIRNTIKRLKEIRFTPKVVHYKEFVNTQTYVQGLSAILNESLGAFANAYLQGETEFLRMMRYTQQTNLTEKQVNRSIEEGYLETGSPQGTAKRLRDELLGKMKDGKFLSLIDKNGDTRRYTVDAYAELVARTKLIEATTSGVTQSTLAAGGDLIQVSVHNTSCQICQEFEGKIYSLSGNDPEFPAAYELPPYHPNCQHTTDPTFREGMEAQGTLDNFIEFSNGETEIHPTRKSFIPVSQRKEE